MLLSNTIDFAVHDLSRVGIPNLLHVLFGVVDACHSQLGLLHL
mgnify:FL=1